MKFVMGANGRLGQKIISMYPDQEVVILKRDLYDKWWQANSVDGISKYFNHHAINEDSILFIASGLLDPSIPADLLYKINYLIPKHVIQGVSRVGIQTITFGTVMEQLFNTTTANNAYIASKCLLNNFIAQFSKQYTKLIHIQMHTLYGGHPSAFMFIGQILHCLKKRTLFKMSSGTQLREYHHIEDEIQAIQSIIHSKTSGIIDLSHGNPITLKQLATYIFDAFNCQELLAIGDKSEQLNDNFSVIFQPSQIFKHVVFREQLSGVTEYLKSSLKSDL